MRHELMHFTAQLLEQIERDAKEADRESSAPADANPAALFRAHLAQGRANGLYHAYSLVDQHLRQTLYPR